MRHYSKRLGSGPPPTHEGIGAGLGHPFSDLIFAKWGFNKVREGGGNGPQKAGGGRRAVVPGAHKKQEAPHGTRPLASWLPANYSYTTLCLATFPRPPALRGSSSFAARLTQVTHRNGQPR